MNILLVCSSFPYPPHEGIKMPVYNLIRSFTKNGHSVILLSFIRKDEKKYLSTIKSICKEVVVVEHTISKDIIKRVFYTLFGKKPFNIYQFYSEKFLEELKRIINFYENIDVIFFDFFTVAEYASFLNIKTPILLHYYDAMSMLFYRNFVVENNILKKYYWYKQYKKLLNFENRLQFIFDKIVVVSSKDKNWLCEKSKIEPTKIKVIPNGVDIEYFYYKFNTSFEEQPYSLLFRGIMSFKPNIDACIYFLKKIYPIIKKEIPEVKFYIVGPNPPKNLIRYTKKDKNIIITGYVEDVREYIVKCKINICPMISGSGIKNKILEALAMGTPSVITPIASEGIPELKDKENILIASNPQEFATKIKLLFEDEQLYRKISLNGRKLIEENYTWQKVAGEFEKVFKEISSK
ncbi:MAG: glycosyltransferase family 4 protein [Endomicrobiia bacterium]